MSPIKNYFYENLENVSNWSLEIPMLYHEKQSTHNSQSEAAYLFYTRVIYFIFYILCIFYTLYKGTVIYRHWFQKYDWIEQLIVADEPVLKPIGDHLEKTTQSSVFVSKSYFEASEIGLECSQYVSFDNSKHKYY